MKDRSGRARTPRRSAELRRAEGGAATILALSWMLVIASFAWVGMLAAVATARQHRVDGAADLIALSAAARLQGGADACRIAADFARRNDVSMRSCRVDGDDVVVAVADEVGFGFGIRRDLIGQARAGPTDR